MISRVRGVEEPLDLHPGVCSAVATCLAVDAAVDVEFWV
jgi:hypothetical protein